MIQTLLMLVGIMPFILTWPYLPFVSWTMEASTVIFCVFFIAVVFFKSRKEQKIELNPLALTAFLLVLLTIVNSLVNDQAYIRVPLVTAVYLLMVSFMAIAVKRAQDLSVDVLTWLVKGIFVCSCIQIVFGYLQFGGLVSQYSAWMGYQYLWIPRYPLLDYATGLFFQANHLVDFMFISLAATIYLFVQKRLPKVVLIVWTILAAGTCTLAGSRSSFLYVFIFLIIGSVVLWKNKQAVARSAGKTMIYTSIAMAVLQIAIKPLMPLFHFSLKQGIDRLANENLFGMRMRFWQKGLMMFQDNPWFGVGWGNFGQEGMNLQSRWAYDKEFITGDFFHHSHNFFIQLLAETGTVGTLPILIGIFFVIRSLVRGPWDEKRIFVITALAVVFCHSQLEYPLWYSYFLLPLAALLSTQDTTWVSLKTPRIAFNSLAGLILVAILAGSVISIYWHSQLVPIINSPMNRPLTAEEDEIVTELSQRPMIAEMSDFAVLTRKMDLSDKDLKEKLKLTERLEKTRPNTFVLFRRAVYLSYDGQYTRALECIDKAFLNSGAIDDMVRFYNQIKPDQRLAALRQKLETLLKQNQPK